DQDPAGWVWQKQQPLIISRLRYAAPWPPFVGRARREFGIRTLLLLSLTAGESRLGAFGFSSVAPYDPCPNEIAFLERVATEFAVAVESSLARQEADRKSGV